jgi:hypothetical protein
MDGVDEYKGNERRWAVGTVMENYGCNQEDESLMNLSAQSMVDDVWYFIVESCNANDQPIPKIHLVVEDVERELKELGEG